MPATVASPTMVLLLLVLTAATAADDPTIAQQLNMSTVQLIESQGYNVTEYVVEVPDGYLIKMQRILGKVGSDLTAPKKGLPVFVLHGFACESTVWVDQGKDSLAFLLSDEGYDVWLGNMRGNRNSANKNYNSSNLLFWDFTWDSIIEQDVPIQWQFVLNQTKATQLQHVGLSMGVATAMGALSSIKGLVDKVKCFFGMGPVTRLTYTTNEQYRVLGVACKLITAVQPVLLFPYDNTPPNPPSCHIPDSCTNTELLLNTHCASGTSFKSGLQGLQLTTEDQFSHFDYGYLTNIFEYANIFPAAYNLTKVSLPVFLYAAAADDQADPLDVALLVHDLPNVRQHRIVDYDLFLHGDFLRSPNVKSLVYDYVLKDLSSCQ